MGEYLITDQTGRKYWTGRQWVFKRALAKRYVRWMAEQQATLVGGTPELVEKGIVS
jgi:hypothetical protein